MRRSHLFASALALVIAAALLAAEAARACSCAPLPPPKEARDAAAAVFTATVVNIETTQAKRQVHLRIAQIWKGGSCGETTVATGLGDADCGYGFEVGKTYLVYADRADRAAGKLVTNLCSRTAPVDQADEDLAALGAPARDCGQG